MITYLFISTWYLLKRMQMLFPGSIEEQAECLFFFVLFLIFFVQMHNFCETTTIVKEKQ